MLDASGIFGQEEGKGSMMIHSARVVSIGSQKNCQNTARDCAPRRWEGEELVDLTFDKTSFD
jgi:hypothetical protein